MVIAAELIMTIVEACALSDFPMTGDKLPGYAGKNSRSVNEAIKAALWMRLIERHDDGYVAPPSIRSEFSLGKEQKGLIFLKYLQRRKSFVQFATFLDYENEPSEASEKVRVLYQIDVPAAVILQLFGGWGRSAGIFEGNNQSLRLKQQYRASDLPTEYLEGLKDALENDMKARVFVNRKLTKEIFRSLPDAGVERAVRAIRGIGTDARNSVEDAGELLEDYLRGKASREGVSVTSASGIGEVLKILEGKQLSESKVTAEHKSIAGALNTLRIMSAHPTRATTGLRWEIKPDSGLEAVLLVLSLIRSIHEYDLERISVF